jgi:hypothetical protein
VSGSGTFRLNLPGVLCARATCNHRRDEHLVDEHGIAHECMHARCACARFFAGGMTEEEQRKPTDPELRIDLDDGEDSES